MQITSPKITDLETCWLLIKDISRESKIWLINRLSESLLDKNKETEVLMKDKIDTTKFIESFAGAWKSNKSAEEIIQAIEESRTSKDSFSLQ